MKYLWVIINLVLVALALRGGYVSLSPEELSHTNPGPIVCLIILLITPVFAMLMVSYSVQHRKSGPLRRASWDRNPLNWWRDPLQSLFISTCVVTALALGSSVRWPTFGSTGFWAMGVYASFAIGLFIGQILVYRVHRQSITSS